LGIIGALLAVLCLLIPSPAIAELPGRRCIIIDSDAALDDVRAVATLASTGRIAAIVVTEGLARGPEGAGAMAALLARGGLSIPVIPGASPNPHRGYLPDERLPAWRANAERLNGLLPAPVPLSGAPGDFVAALRHHTRGCAGISLLVIGPWTSFVRYAAELLGRVERIVAQGRPYPDEPGGEPSGFNCVYDLDSCFAAFDLLVGRQQRAGPRFRAEWADIPNSPEACGSAEPGIDARGEPLYAFRPTEAWLEELDRAGGMARVIADMLRANPEGWEQTSLWDDLAALYLLRRDIFVFRGGHLEPCIPAAAVRSLLAAAMARGGSR
jgi:hypothetical protein